MMRPIFQAPLESSHSHHRKENVIFRGLRNSFLTGQEEKKLWKKGRRNVVGLDESGRGPLAGPVVAAAVVIIGKCWKSDFQHIRDSKKLSPKKREYFYEILTRHKDIKWGTGRVSEKVIDKINILEATKLAMQKALQNLKGKPGMKSHDRRFSSRKDFLILDGNFLLDGLDIPQRAIVKADEKVFSCMAAGIIAKVTRDRIMKRYHKKYPCYYFNKHKGYPTKEHIKMIKKYKPCKIHRMSFGPVSESLKRKAQSVKLKRRTENY